ncbi:MAG: hypothetical protein PWP47_1262, partial [Synergistaceae bacterium]|nr:hypothetical protein [Synergistaceae bacterium]
TDIRVGFSHLRRPSPGDNLFAPGEGEFTLCPATLPLPEKCADLGLRQRIMSPDGASDEEADLEVPFVVIKEHELAVKEEAGD